jgi:enoyl-CoA hydratase
MNSYKTIRFERDDNVATLTLTRPEKRNAQNPQMWEELGDLGTRVGSDRTLRCLVVAGEGPSFSAGLDLVEGLGGIIADFAARPAQELTLESAMSVAGTFAWIPKLHCPSIAAVQGHAYGAGLQLALACDFRIFGQSAEVGLVETRFGIMPDMGATVRLPRIIGEARAREMIMLGEVIDADEALRIGLANRVVGDLHLQEAASDMASRLANQPPLAIQGARRAIEAAWHLDPDKSFEIAVRGQIRCLESDDFREARRAFANGDRPTWRGR